MNNGIVAHLSATIVADHESVCILWGNPQIVVVAMGSVACLKGSPAIIGDVVGDVHHVDSVHVLGVGVNAAVVPSALAQAAVRIGALPCLSCIIGSVHAPFVIFDDQVGSKVSKLRLGS